jgi:hypothetical protein
MPRADVRSKLLNPYMGRPNDILERRWVGKQISSSAAIDFTCLNL